MVVELTRKFGRRGHLSKWETDQEKKNKEGKKGAEDLSFFSFSSFTRK